MGASKLALKVCFLQHILLKFWLQVILDIVSKLIKDRLAHLRDRLRRIASNIDGVLVKLQHLFLDCLEL